MTPLARLTALCVSLATPLAAADVALVIGNEDYDAFSRLRDGTDVTDAARALRRAGVTVLSVENGSQARTRQALAQFAQVAPNADAVLVVLSGRFLNSATETYFLPVDSDGPSLAGIGAEALSLSTVTAILAAVPGRAVLVVASDDEDATFGRFLREGLGEIDLPQGVTLVRATPDAAASFLEDTLAVPGRSLVDGAARLRDAEVEGFLPRDMVFVEEEEEVVAIAPIQTTSAEDLYWEATRDLDTVDAYSAYLSRYPNGTHAAEARKAIADIRAEPARAARRAEEALALSRDQRRQIQRNLSILDFNTRGIDGIFGPGSRAAIGSWQGQNGFEASTYLSADQITVLSDQAARRAAELEAEAEARRLEQEREDRAYWRATGAAGDEAGFRSYLKRFPDGRYAEIATARLKVIEDEKRATAQAAERAEWDDAQSQNTLESYQTYVNRYPNGLFAAEAQARIDEFRTGGQNNAELQQAAAAENALRLSTGTRRLVETRLNALGLKPGRVDGTFDERTRRAIRRYQEVRGLKVTGYVSEAMIVRLLAEGIFR